MFRVSITISDHFRKDPMVILTMAVGDTIAFHTFAPRNEPGSLVWKIIVNNRNITSVCKLNENRVRLSRTVVVYFSRKLLKRLLNAKNIQNRNVCCDEFF